MLKVLVASLLLFSFTAQFSEAKLCQDSLSSETCLSFLLTEKCKLYGASSFGQSRTYQCMTAANTFLEMFDMGTIDIKITDTEVKTYYIAFSKDLQALLKDFEVQWYLHDLAADLKSAYENEGKVFSLWDYTLKRAKTSEKALHWIAVLFQDTSRLDDYTEEFQRAPFLSYLFSKNKSLISAQRDQLDQITTILDYVATGKADQIHLYPSGLDKNLSGGFYHFYTIAWAARLMANDGVSEEMAYFIPMLFNSIYEFREYTYSGWPIKDPKRPYIVHTDMLDPSIKEEVSPEWSIRDLYTGYVGALWGANHLKNAQNYQGFKAKINEDTASWIHDQFRIDF